MEQPTVKFLYNWLLEIELMEYIKMVDNCIYCGEDIYPDDESCSKGFGQAHIECAEREDPEELD